MKPVRYDYERPADTGAAMRLLGEAPGAKIIAGGQSLGPMLNLRLAQPDLLVDVSGISDLAQVYSEGDGVVIGACVTHAAVEDGRFCDPTLGILPRVARSIAYRAVRNRGTIGGSIAHADPAADWVTVLSALGAEILISGLSGQRRSTIGNLMHGAYDLDIGHDELVTGVRIGRSSTGARWGYFKFCRKMGEFADAMAAVFIDPDRQIHRGVIGATDSKPIVIEDLHSVVGYSGPASVASLVESGQPRAHAASLASAADDIKNHMLSIAFERALVRVAS